MSKYFFLSLCCGLPVFAAQICKVPEPARAHSQEPLADELDEDTVRSVMAHLRFTRLAEDPKVIAAVKDSLLAVKQRCNKSWATPCIVSTEDPEIAPRLRSYMKRGAQSQRCVWSPTGAYCALSCSDGMVRIFDQNFSCCVQKIAGDSFQWIGPDRLLMQRSRSEATVCVYDVSLSKVQWETSGYTTVTYDPKHTYMLAWNHPAQGSLKVDLVNPESLKREKTIILALSSDQDIHVKHTGGAFYRLGGPYDAPAVSYFDVYDNEPYFCDRNLPNQKESSFITSPDGTSGFIQVDWFFEGGFRDARYHYSPQGYRTITSHLTCDPSEVAQLSLKHATQSNTEAFEKYFDQFSAEKNYAMLEALSRIPLVQSAGSNPLKNFVAAHTIWVSPLGSFVLGASSQKNGGSACEEEPLKLFDCATQEEHFVGSPVLCEEGLYVWWSPDERCAIVCSATNELAVLDPNERSLTPFSLENGKTIRHTGQIKKLAVNTGGDRLLSLGTREVVCWSLPDLSPQFMLVHDAVLFDVHWADNDTSVKAVAALGVANETTSEYAAFQWRATSEKQYPAYLGKVKHTLPRSAFNYLASVRSIARGIGIAGVDRFERGTWADFVADCGGNSGLPRLVASVLAHDKQSFIVAYHHGMLRRYARATHEASGGALIELKRCQQAIDVFTHLPPTLQERLLRRLGISTERADQLNMLNDTLGYYGCLYGDLRGRSPLAPGAQDNISVDGPVSVQLRLQECSPDKRKVVHVFSDGSICILRSEDSSVLHTLPGDAGGVQQVSWSHQGDLLAGVVDKVVLLWSPEDGQRIAILHHGAEIQALLWSLDDSHVLSRSSHQVKVWTRHGRCLLTATDDNSRVVEARFISEANRVSVEYEDGSVKIFDTETGALFV